MNNKWLSRAPGVSEQTGSPDPAAQLSVSWWCRAPDEVATGCITQWSWCDIWPQRPQPQLLKGKSNQCSIDSVRARWKPNYRPSRHSWSFYAASQIKPVLCTIALLCGEGGWPSSPPPCCYGKNSHLSFLFCLFVYIRIATHSAQMTALNTTGISQKSCVIFTVICASKNDCKQPRRDIY